MIKLLLTGAIASIMASAPVMAEEPAAEKKTDTEVASSYDYSGLKEQLLQQMVKVEGGSFMMGSDDPQAREMEKPVHKVELNDFYISKYEITQDQFSLVTGKTASYFRGDELPADTVSRLETDRFIARLNKVTGKQFRLPTEAEWEYAARGGRQSKGYRYAGSDDLDQVGWYSGNSDKKTHPVGQKKPNELGLYDMSGNVWEWCQDVVNRMFYKMSPVENPISKRTDDPNFNMMATRGGSYEYDPLQTTVFYREGATQGARVTGFGIRLAMSTLEDAPEIEVKAEPEPENDKNAVESGDKITEAKQPE